MNKKICLITGATSGIGKAVAVQLAEIGYSLILTGRNIKKGNNLVNHLKTKFHNYNVEFIGADMSSMNEVKKLADIIRLKYNSLDILINNAGARFNEFRKSSDGIEMTFAVNYLGHFLLTSLLMNIIKKSPSARIINISSSAHSSCTNDFSDAANPVNYNRKTAYCKSKLANILFTYELAGRLKDKAITVNAVNPGGVLTRLGKNNGYIAWFRHITYHLIKRELQLPLQAAESVVYLADSPEIEGITGKYFYKKKEIKSSAASYDKDAAAKLWDFSSGLCNIEVIDYFQ